MSQSFLFAQAVTAKTIVLGTEESECKYKRGNGGKSGGTHDYRNRKIYFIGSSDTPQDVLVKLGASNVRYKAIVDDGVVRWHNEECGTFSAQNKVTHNG